MTLSPSPSTSVWNRARSTWAVIDNGDVESLNGHLMRRIRQHLLVRGGSDFVSLELYDAFLFEVLMVANAPGVGILGDWMELKAHGSVHNPLVYSDRAPDLISTTASRSPRLTLIFSPAAA